MVERICPQCQHGNPIENRFCGHCGAPMERNDLVPEQGQSSMTNLSEQLPVPMRQLGQAVLVSLAALAAEAGLAWLRRRIDHINHPPPAQQPTTQVVSYPVAQPVMHATPQPMMTIVPAQKAARVTIQSQRTVETWEHGVLKQHTVERNIWRREEG
jgi:hypothetical protein